MKSRIRFEPTGRQELLHFADVGKRRLDGNDGNSESDDCRCQHQIDIALALSERMIRMAEQQETCCSDDGCLVLFGIIRDNAYAIRKAAEKLLILDNHSLCPTH